MTWHPEILTRQQQRVLAQVAPWLTRNGFYLARGTAVALHLGHRRSVDLDWFTGEKMPDPLRRPRNFASGELPLSPPRWRREP